MSFSTIRPLAASTERSAENPASEENEGTLSHPRGRPNGNRALPHPLGQLQAFGNVKGRDVRVTSGNNPFFKGPVRPHPTDARIAAMEQRARIATLLITRFYRSFPRNSDSCILPNAADAAKEHIKKYPELNALADSSVAVTQEAAGGTVPVNNYSSILGKPQHFVEFERSLLSLRCLNLLIDGSAQSHKEWTSAQKSQVLDYPSFASLSERWCGLVEHYAAKGSKPEELRQAAEVALVLGDMGKAESVRTMMAEVGIRDVDHDDFYGHVMREPRALELLPSFQRLRPDMRELLQKTADLAHFGHITHCEGGSMMFRKLKQSDILNEDRAAFDFAVFVHMCDVAGAAGHRNPQGSLTLTQETLNVIEETFKACLPLKDTNEVEAYKSLLRTRAEWLRLSPSDEEDLMLARLGAMARFTTPEQGKALKEAFEQLSDVDRGNALRHLSVAGADTLPVTPTYMPAAIANAINNPKLGKSLEQRLSNAIKIVVPFITSVLATYRAMLQAGTMSADIPLNFNKIAGMAAKEPTRIRPEAAQINRETGEVTVRIG